VAPLADSRGPLLPNSSLALMLWCPAKLCFKKMFKNIFQRVFVLRNIFQDFCEKENG
jgi:hypothetical protein